MKNKVLFFVLMLNLVCISSVFAIKPLKSSSKQLKVKNDVSESDNVAESNAAKTDNESKSKSKTKTSKKENKVKEKDKKITKIFIPGHDKNNLDLTVQGIA